MNVLVVGSGGREAAIIRKLYNDITYYPNLQLFCYGSSPNLDIIDRTKLSKFNSEPIDSQHIFSILYFSKHHRIQYAIIGSENYLEKGIVDLLELNNIKCIGPCRLLAQIETNKAFTRRLIQNTPILKIYNPIYKEYSDLSSYDKLNDYMCLCNSLGLNYVIKATRLRSGKGVFISGDHFKTHFEGLKISLDLLNSGTSILIEEKLVGEEYTLMSYTDGTHFSHMPIVQDFKKELNGDLGVNTGSMGCICYGNHSLPFLTDKNIEESQFINELVIKSLQKKEGDSYKGIIYGSFIKCSKSGKLKIIEYNCRYGDPECIPILELLTTPLIEIYTSIVEKSLDKVSSNYTDSNVIVKYIVPKEYPHKKIPKKSILLNNEWIERWKPSIIVASVYSESKSIYCTSSRSLVFINSSKQDITELAKMTNDSINELMTYSDNLKYRSDIGLNSSITYKSSGVDVDKASKALALSKDFIKSTYNSHVLGNDGDFGGLYDPKWINVYDKPIFVSTIDGVGTKISFLYNLMREDAYTIIGTDIVNHCVNDILVKGAKPMFFLDYIASDILKPNSVQEILKSMSSACKNHNCVLIGGELAEMPGTYNKNEVDVVGCMIGAVEQDFIINGYDTITSDDLIIGLPSYGLHTNGFSLIRKLADTYTLSPSLVSWLKQPHTSYFNTIQLLIEANINICGLCHITGGGLTDNIPRVVPKYLKSVLNKTYLGNDHFKEIQIKANMSDEDMYRTFNCGYGMLIFISQLEKDKLNSVFNSNTIPYEIIGHVKLRNDADYVEYI